MSGNSSSSNDSLLQSQFPPDSLSFLLNTFCYISKPASFIFITTNVASIVILLPIIIFILYHGVRQHHSISSVSHSDVFTYHMVIIELIGVFGYVLILSVSVGYNEDLNILLAGSLISVFNWYGQTFFHVLTCLERYLAVVHPITYRSLKNERGVRIRNGIIGVVWLLCLVGTGLRMKKRFIIVDICLYLLPLVIVFFCSLSVLCVLIHPGPGEQGGTRERVDQSKKRTFYTIVAILGALVLRFVGSLFWKLGYTSGISNGCLIMGIVSWAGLPSSLVLPLLFLHRTRTLVCCKNNHI